MFGRYRFGISALVGAFLVATATAGAARPAAATYPLFDGLGGGSGSTVGPGGDLYVTDTVNGRVVRVDPRSGDAATYADCLPRQIAAVGLGGGMDVAFLGHTAYALVTLVDGQVGGTDVDGIYRIDGPHTCTVVADIGAWAIAHPPCCFDYFVQTGVQYALEPYRHGFLVTDGHHNRVLEVGLDGSISAVRSFGDIVPTGLALRGHTVYMAEAGPVPHLPENGKVVSFAPESSGVTDVASGGRLLVDVELGRTRSLFALAQGHFTPGHDPGSPADPNTGELLVTDGHGGFTVVANGLNRPTSLELIGNDAFVVTLGGEVWRIDDAARRR